MLKKFNLKKFTFLLIIINIIFFIGLTLNSKPQVTSNVSAEEREVYLNILTTDKLAYSMVKSIVKDKHYVQYMFTDENQILNYKYTDDSINNVSNMDLFIYMGTGYEPWINDFIGELKKGKVGIINASRGIRTINYDEVKTLNTYDFKTNPYYWLSPEDLKISLYNIKSAIQEKDPKNREYYEENYNIILENLDDVLKIFNEKISNLKQNHIQVIGSNLDYLMRYLGVNYSKIKQEELEQKIRELEENNLIDNKEKNKENNICNIVFFDNNDEFTKYSDRLTNLNYKCILVNKPNSLESYKNYISTLGETLDNLINENANLENSGENNTSS